MTAGALATAERAVELQPGNADAWYQLGIARLDAGQLDRSEPCWRRVIALAPLHAKAHVNLGLVMQFTGRREEALRCYREAAAAEPTLAQAWFNLGALLLEERLPLDAVDALRRALALDAGQAQWHAALGSALGEAGFPREALENLRAALRGDSSLRHAKSDILYTLNRIPGMTPQRISEEHLAWGRGEIGAPDAAAHANSREPDRRLRLGYLAADFRDPAIAPFVQPALAWRDASAFDVFCYSDAPKDDLVHWRLPALGVTWRSCAELGDDQLTDTIRADGIDLLVDLTGHAAGGRRLPVLARKPAPVQAGWLGYPCTTGLPAIDYRLSDSYLCPPGAESLYVERLIRLPGNQYCIAPIFGTPETAPLPAEGQRVITFGALHGLVAQTPEIVALWAKVLARVPGARLIIAAHGADARVRERFAAAGADPAGIEVVGALAPFERRALLSRIDIGLDVHPWSGAAEALEALWMGVPVVTLEGPAAASRQAAAILRALGLAELVAADEGAYVQIAAALARDRVRLASLRSGLRGRLERSALCDGERFTRGLEAAYRRMWRTWCAAEAPSAFEVPSAAPGAPQMPAHPVRPAAGGPPPRVVLDGVFFQDYDGGIARVWRMLLREWVESGFAKNVLLLDREETAPRVAGVSRRVIEGRDYERLAEDRRLLQAVCDEEGAQVFVSTYYSSPLRTPSVMMAYDMIPEVFGADLSISMWRQKAECVRSARAFLAISASTARDLCSLYPFVDPRRVTVAHCGVSPLFRPAGAEEVAAFRAEHGITRPYFLLVGSRVAYKNGDAFLRAFARLADRDRYAVVCVGGGRVIEPELQVLREGVERHMLRLDDDELRLAYGGAVALAYPSIYEGFGMPVAEALACGCPVITTALTSLPEVAGDAALYVKPLDIAALERALVRVQDPVVRRDLVAKGVERARLFSWTGMAKTVAQVLADTATRGAAP